MSRIPGNGPRVADVLKKAKEEAHLYREVIDLTELRRNTMGR